MKKYNVHTHHGVVVVEAELVARNEFRDHLFCAGDERETGQYEALFPDCQVLYITRIVE